eukprot:167773_1
MVSWRFILLLSAVTDSRVLLSNDWATLKWVTVSVPLPREEWNMAVASYNDSIFIFGGSNYMSQAVKFNLLSQTITDLGDDVLPFNLYGNSKYYTQINHLFYAIDPVSDPTNIIIYNLITKQVSNIKTMTQNVGQDGCLSSTNGLLLVIGGISNEKTESKTPVSTTQIFNISSQNWTIGVHMATPRAYHTCCVDPIDSVLYAIGGLSEMDGSPLSTVERIPIHKMFLSEATSTTSSWHHIQSLSGGVIYASSIMVPSTHQIFVFFGIKSKLSIVSEHGASASSSQIIDCDSGTSTAVSIGPQDTFIYAAAALSVRNKIYSFGGIARNTYGGTVNTCLSMHLFPTISPTYYPTKYPTQPPTTANPTLYVATPTHAPTSLTTSLLTDNPSVALSSTSMISTEVIASGFHGKSQADTHNSVVFVCIASALCCIVCLIGYILYQKNRERKLMEEYGEPIDVGYVELSENFEREGHNDTKWSDKQRQRNNMDDIEEEDVDDDNEDLYQYAPPTNIGNDNVSEGTVCFIPTPTDKGDDISAGVPPELCA